MTTAPSTDVVREDGFDVYLLRTVRCEIAVVPALGARIVRLRNRETDREWLWTPDDRRPLFANAPGDDFAHSPLVGVDECLPTVAPCSLAGRDHADHGEVWSAGWTVDEAAWARGVLATHVDLRSLPLRLTREIDLAGATVRLRYRLHNRSDRSQPFLWALHPLFRWNDGDRIELSPEVRNVRVTTPEVASGTRWAWPNPSPDVALDRGTLGPGPRCAKLFAGPECGGHARLRHGRSGETLTLRWAVAENPALGIWISRGGWHGCHHVALEPTSSAHDSLAEAHAANAAAVVVAGDTRTWEVALILGGQG